MPEFSPLWTHSLNLDPPSRRHRSRWPTHFAFLVIGLFIGLALRH